MKLTLDASSRSIGFLTLLLIAFCVSGVIRPGVCASHEPWPESSDKAVTPLEHPSIEERAEGLGRPISGYRFAVFGDQRAFADGEWQRIIIHIARLSAVDDSLLFMLDTGDIVENGCYSDQFHSLVEILGPASDLPYLVGVGNHEKSDNERPEALLNTSIFLSYLDDDFGPDRMYYRKDIGPVRFLFMDTNDFVYGDEGDGYSGSGVEPASRGEAQLSWLMDELNSPVGERIKTTIAVMHHPIVQSPVKHRRQSVALWNLNVRGRTLAELLFYGGVDLILTGHTHTYEVFRLSDSKGDQMHLVNISGRPRGDFLWMGRSGVLWIGGVSRRAIDIAGREESWLRRLGWTIPDGWSVDQEDSMTKRQANQFCVFTVEEDGGVLLKPAFLDDDSPRGLRWGPILRIK